MGAFKPDLLYVEQQPYSQLWGIGYYLDEEDDSYDGEDIRSDNFVWLIDPRWDFDTAQQWAEALQPTLASEPGEG